MCMFCLFVIVLDDFWVLLCLWDVFVEVYCNVLLEIFDL